MSYAYINSVVPNWQELAEQLALYEYAEQIGSTYATEEKSSKSEPAIDIKALGAFYTDVRVASFLVRWALRSGNETVMDPSFGGGVFLGSACRRLASLGGEPSEQVFGVEIDPAVHTHTAQQLFEGFGLPEANLSLSDFFAIEAEAARQVDVVVGNPPFIRYHHFSGEMRKRALARAARQGVRLSELSSSWAPFLIHSIAMVKPGGRLAMVVPMEISYAAYAQPVLRHLAQSFQRVTFLTFRRKLFPQLSEDALLLLAEEKGKTAETFLWRDLLSARDLKDLAKCCSSHIQGTQRINTAALLQGNARLVQCFMPKKAREIYKEMKEHCLTQRLGAVADVGIGYVTGANDFFHLTTEQAAFWGIPESYLKPAIRRSRALTGVRFSSKDWERALSSGEAGYLLYIEPGSDIPDGLRRYVEDGETRGVSKAFKCRTRKPWFSVPHVYQPDAFLSYMSGTKPQLVANDAGVVAPNSLHIVRLHPHMNLPNDCLAALWQTSLTRLSTEVEGHSLGGGMLKLEPSEAENVLIAVASPEDRSLSDLAGELDALLRRGDCNAAQELADNEVLKSGLGLSSGDCNVLRTAANELRDRRCSKGKAI